MPIRKQVIVRKLFNDDTKASYIFLAKWIGLALLAGITGSLSVYSFRRLLLSISSLFVSVQLPGLLFSFPLPIFTVLGAVFAGGIIYRIQPDAAGEGLPSYLQALNRNNGYLSIQVTIFKYISGLATLSTFGNGGVVGPLGRFVAGLMSAIGGVLTKIGLSEDDRRTATICGMSAAVGAIFHSPLGGGIFAVEIIQRAKMGYKDLFPAILSSIVSVAICIFFKFEPFYQFSVIDQIMDLSQIGWLVILAVLSGLLGNLYTRLYSLIVKIFRRDHGNVLLKVILGSFLASAAAWLINPELLGTSSMMFTALLTNTPSVLAGVFAGTLPVGAILIIMLILKALFNCLTVGSGMSAGFTGPSILIGMLLGASFAHIIGIEIPSPTYYAFIAAGFSGLLASSINVPLAAAVITTELFGLNYSLPAGLAAIIGFQVNRHHTIYDYALAGAGEKVIRNS